jgi:two-component system sensor histidine kinase KdpD
VPEGSILRVAETSEVVASLASRLRNSRWPDHFGARLIVNNLVGLGAVAVGSVVAELLFSKLGVTRTSFVFLATVVVTATIRGRGVGLITLLGSTAMYGTFLAEPRYSLSWISIDELLLNLGVFVLVAGLTGSLAGDSHDQAERSQMRARSLSALFHANRGLSNADDEHGIHTTLCQAVIDVSGGTEARLVKPDTPVEELGCLPTEALVAWRTAEAGGMASRTVHHDDWRARPLVSSEESYGIQLWTVSADAINERERTPFVDILVDLAASALSSARASRERSDLELTAKANHLREAILSSISHDFRTPLAAIIGSATTLIDYSDKLEPDVVQGLLKNIHGEGERLNDYVSNLLSMTKLEGGALELQLGPVDIAEVVWATIDRCSPNVQERISVDESSVASVLSADKVLLRQVVYNILDNSQKYSAAGNSIEISGHIEADRFFLSIGDHGPGLPQGEHARIFDKFYRARSSSRRKEGTGLGLSIAKGFMKAMGGDVKAFPRRDGLAGLLVEIVVPLWRGEHEEER